MQRLAIFKACRFGDRSREGAIFGPLLSWPGPHFEGTGWASSPLTSGSESAPGFANKLSGLTIAHY